MSGTRELAIYGAGGHGRVVADAAVCAGWEVSVFIDDDCPKSRAPSFAPVVTWRQFLRDHVGSNRAVKVVVAVGDASVRRELTNRVMDAGLGLAVVVHPSASVARSASLGEGTVVIAQAAVGPDAKIGRGCIINTSASVDHDCIIGDFVHVAPGAHLGGTVTVGDMAWIGIGASVREGITVGQGAFVGMGAAVVCDVAPDTTVVGVPSKPV